MCRPFCLPWHLSLVASMLRSLPIYAPSRVCLSRWVYVNSSLFVCVSLYLLWLSVCLAVCRCLGFCLSLSTWVCFCVCLCFCPCLHTRLPSSVLCLWRPLSLCLCAYLRSCWSLFASCVRIYAFVCVAACSCVIVSVLGPVLFLVPVSVSVTLSLPPDVSLPLLLFCLCLFGFAYTCKTQTP